MVRTAERMRIDVVSRALIPPLSDADLVVGARDGHADAEAEIYRRYAAEITALLVRLLGSRSDAQDVLHDTFVSAFECIAGLQNPETLRLWLKRIAVRLVYRRWRRRALLRRLGIESSASTGTSLAELAHPGVSTECRVELSLLNDALRRLPADLRVAWMLRHVEGHSVSEVAELCECSIATVKRRIARTREQLRKHVRLPEVNDE